ncbi:MAG: redoxin domain-containing protein [Smithella sp.]
MKKRVAFIAIILVLAATAALYAATKPPQVGGMLPEMKLQKPADSSSLKYLGLSGSGTFSADQVKSQVLIIQIFSLYCPYCQKDAPGMNRFFSLIESNPKLKGKIKILGIGAGNSQFEVNTFKRKYQVEFPLIPDADFEIHKIIGEVRTPYFIIVKLSGPKKLEVVYSKLGAHENVEAFLAEVVQLAGIQ